MRWLAYPSLAVCALLTHGCADFVELYRFPNTNGDWWKILNDVERCAHAGGSPAQCPFSGPITDDDRSPEMSGFAVVVRKALEARLSALYPSGTPAIAVQSLAADPWCSIIGKLSDAEILCGGQVSGTGGVLGAQFIDIVKLEVRIRTVSGQVSGWGCSLQEHRTAYQKVIGCRSTSVRMVPEPAITRPLDRHGSF